MDFGVDVDVGVGVGVVFPFGVGVVVGFDLSVVVGFDFGVDVVGVGVGADVGCASLCVVVCCPADGEGVEGEKEGFELIN